MLAAAAPAAAVVPDGPQFQFSTGPAARPSLASDSDGDVLGAWEADDGASGGIFARLRTPSGDFPLGADNRLNSFFRGSQLAPAAAALGNDTYVVAWESANQDPPRDNDGISTDLGGIYKRHVTLEGAAAGGEAIVPTTTAGKQRAPAVAAAAGGDYVVVWVSTAGANSDNGSIQGQRFNASGNPEGGQFPVSSPTEVHDTDPAVAMAPDGRFVVTWVHAHPGDVGNDDVGIHGRRFGADGTALASEFTVNPTTAGPQQEPAVAPAPDGGFVAVWTGPDGSSRGIFGQRYDDSGQRVGAEFRVNADPVGIDINASVGSDGAGNFVVSWTHQSNEDTDVRARRYLADGTPDAQGEFVVYTGALFSTDERGGISSVAVDDAGNFVVGWHQRFLSTGLYVDPILAQAYLVDPRCSDGTDNDGDGETDYPGDQGCADADDVTEDPDAPQCSDRLDNDGDGQAGYPDDQGCTSTLDDSEAPDAPQCSDRLDNDSDGQQNFPADQGCADADDNSEAPDPPQCADRLDNDSDGEIGFPDDQGCADATDDSEAAAPVVTTSKDPTTYTENAAPVAIDDALTVSDSDSVNLESAQVRISAGLEPGDALSFSDQNGISGSYDSANGLLSLTGTATVAQYETALRSVKFATSGDDPATSRTVEFLKVSDGAPNAATATKDLAITRQNDAPSLSASAGQTTYGENAAAIPIDGALTATDPDDADLESARVRLSAGFEPGDSVSFTDQNGISGNYDSGTGVLTLAGTATVAQYQAALRAVTFATNADDPPASKSVEFKTSDGDADSNLATKTLAITPEDDAPTAVGDAKQVAAGSAPATIDVLANDTDVDGGPERVDSVTQPAHGTVSIASGGASLTYAPAAGYCNSQAGGTPDSFIYKLNGGSEAAVSVTVTCPDPVTGAGNSQAGNPAPGGPSLTPPSFSAEPTVILPVARLAVSHRRLIVRAGRAPVRLRCLSATGGRCEGTIALRATSLDSRAHASAVKLARRRFSIPAGTTQTISPLVPRTTKRQLRRRGKAVVSAVFALGDGQPAAFTQPLTLIPD